MHVQHHGGWSETHHQAHGHDWVSVLNSFGLFMMFLSFSATQKVLYKAVFHGGMKSMWSRVMEEPPARKVGKCITSHDLCVEHQMLAAHINNYYES